MIDTDNGDIVFVCEHWLTQHEIACFKQRSSDHDRWTYMKSSVDAEELSTGRPHGGIGFIANRVRDVTYKPLNVECDRITGMQLVSNGRIVVTIFGVYLPYFRANADQIKLYSETLDILQSAIDGMDSSPIMIVGDMNAPLPRQAELSRYWYRLYPFNRHSYILYDFLRNNDFVVANFNFEQDVSYTYFNTISRSYIDHVFISKDTRNTVTACAIVSDLPSNVSDHFPVCTTLSVLVTSKGLDIVDSGMSSLPSFPRVDWSDNKNCTAYSRYMDVAATSLPGVNLDTVTSRDEARKTVESMCNAAVTVMHECCSSIASDKHDVYKGRFKPNRWWNRDCLVTRDRQRLWYGIWKSCGRPRLGHVYMCYKSAKKTYRRACNQAMNSNFNQLSRRINDLYRGRHMKRLWNFIRSTKRDKSVHDDIGVSDLHKYFSAKFCDSEYTSDVILEAEICVQEKYDDLLNGELNSKVMSEAMVKRYIKK